MWGLLLSRRKGKWFAVEVRGIAAEGQGTMERWNAENTGKRTTVIIWKLRSTEKTNHVFMFHIPSVVLDG